MCNTITKFILITLFILLSACGGGGNDDAGDQAGDSNPSVAAKTSLVAIGDVDCTYGGVLLETGIDENANGVLDDNEVDKSEKVCNGSPGSDGTNGLDGADGANGLSGADGANGLNGADGANGLNGTDGANGLSGTDGANGLSGADGANGLSGTDGTNGLDGTDGTNGLNGADGANGLDGADGANGLNGADGTNGLNGANGLNWWDDLGTTGTLEGYVYREAGTPAEGAMVNITGTPHYAFTSGFGYYRFDYITVGHQHLDISIDGYYTQHREELAVTANKTTAVRDVRLNKKRLPLPAKVSLASAMAFSGKSTNDRSGRSVAGAGDINGDGFDDILIGAYFADPDGKSNAGESYLIYGGLTLSTNIALSSADITLSGVAADDSSGYSVAGAGDINGDGFDDVLIGASEADPHGIDNAGESYLIMGRPRGIDTPSNQLNGNYSLAMANARFIGAAATDSSGYSVARAGDVNGDGFDDILIGAHRADPDSKGNAGETYLVYGRPGMDINQALGMEADITLSGVAEGDHSGYSVAGAGDINGDGFDDILIGAYQADPGGKSSAGESYLIYGGPALATNITLSSADITLSGGVEGDHSGYSVAGAGDINGDGFDDILIGAYQADPGGKSIAGESYLIYGGPALSANITLSSADITLSGVAAGNRSGVSLAGAGDINGDGFDDILIGAYFATPDGKSSAGKSYLIYGGPALSTNIALSSADITLSGGAVGDNSGVSVAGAGDINGDGFDDILIGAFFADPDGKSDAGESYLIYGGPALSANIALSSAAITFSGVAADDLSGYSVAGAGDINGDGFDDILIGAREASPGGINSAGKSYLFLGQGKRSME